MGKEISVPPEFIYFPFYTANDVIGVDDTNTPFYYDIIYTLTKNADEPWKNKKHYLPLIFNEFKTANIELSQFYKNRDRKSARPVMITQLAHFIDSLYWTNDMPVSDLANWKGAVKGFTYKPVNVEERLLFILNDPDHFHSYNQLKSLYDEMEKIFYKSMLRDSAK